MNHFLEDEEYKNEHNTDEDNKFIQGVLKAIRKGYNLRNSTEIAGKELGLNFTQSWGAWYRLQSHLLWLKDAHEEAKRESKNKIVKRINWYKIDHKIESAMLEGIENGIKPPEIATRLSDSLNELASDIYARWTNVISKQYKTDEISKRKEKKDGYTKLLIENENLKRELERYKLLNEDLIKEKQILIEEKQSLIEDNKKLLNISNILVSKN